MVDVWVGGQEGGKGGGREERGASEPGRSELEGMAGRRGRKGGRSWVMWREIEKETEEGGRD
eukprot:1124373-Rhodomonas_salina.1